MKILYIKLVNFADVYAAMHKEEIEFDFSGITKPIIQIYGKNRSGKTVLIQKLHPFSSINLNGDDRNDVPLIRKGKPGLKQIVYQVNDDVYTITHTYKPTTHGHTVSSSIVKNGEELNAAGGVNTFNNMIDNLFGINRYVFQFVINGTQLTSFAGLNSTQRKTLLNKAMGIDIYDKIHKMATDDYRYTSKLISSLNNTKEYLLQSYGSYETLQSVLSKTRDDYNTATRMLSDIKSRIDKSTGVIESLRSQNIYQNLGDITNKLDTYNRAVSNIGEYSPTMYDSLVEQQLSLNTRYNEAKSERLLLLKDQDIMYEKRNNIQSEMLSNQRAVQDYQNLLNVKSDIERKIQDIQITVLTEAPASAFMSMLSLAQAINDTCREIISSLSDNHLKLFCDMILKGIDIPAFLMKEGSVLLDSEKEKSTISRIRSMLNTVTGETYECGFDDCLYKNMFDRLSQYFKSYESVTDGEFTQYDLEQFEHSWKNYQTILRLIKVEIPKELEYDFSIESILTNLKNGSSYESINVENIKRLAEEAAKIELRKNYIQRLSEIETSIKNMETLSLKSNNDPSKMIQELDRQLESIGEQISEKESLINSLSEEIADNETKRTMLSSIKNVDINELVKRQNELLEQQSRLTNAENQLQSDNVSYITIQNDVNNLASQLESLENANKQYVSTVNEIERLLTMDQRYKIISEATSSTKGKPVIAIRDKMSEALLIANRLLNVMYDGEIELLRPVIDETTFTLPFRCGTNTSDDIKTGSQSESTLLSLALSLSLASTLTKYNVMLVDECDGYLDAGMRDVFVLMLQEIMSTLKMEQMFIISHSIQPDQYSHIVHTINISRE
jgi:DNA repair exonuclease SbcCD ATPase subunit